MRVSLSLLVAATIGVMSMASAASSAGVDVKKIAEGETLVFTAGTTSASAVRTNDFVTITVSTSYADDRLFTCDLDAATCTADVDSATQTITLVRAEKGATGGIAVHIDHRGAQDVFTVKTADGKVHAVEMTEGSDGVATFTDGNGRDLKFGDARWTTVSESF